MKKRMLMVSFLLVAFVATFATGATVTGNNWVGYVQVDAPAPGEFGLLGVNFEAIGDDNDGSVPLDEVIATNNLEGHPFRTSARDQFYLWDEVNSKYEFYSYNEGTFYNKDGEEDVPLVNAGDALWLSSSPNAPADRKIHIKGQVDLSPASTVAKLEGFQLCSNPYPTVLDFTEMDWLAQGATGSFRASLSDKIYLYENNKYHVYSLNENGNWENGGEEVEALEIAPGQGFWYKAQESYENEYIRPFDVE